MRTLEIATAGPWNVFFLLAVLLGFGLAWRQGERAGAPRAEWLALLALAVAAGIVGGRLLHFDVAAPAGAKTILGAVLLAALALYGGARFLRLDPRALDGLALALPVGFALGRIGCLLAGCCFGHPTDLPWGAIYDTHSAAFRAQVAAGLIPDTALQSLPVHPTQLYEATMALLVAGGVHGVRRMVRRPGSALLAVLILLGAGRLALESYRDRDTMMLLGLTSVQWLLLALLAAACVALSRREQRATTYPTFRRTGPVTRLLLVASAAPAILILAGGLLTPAERVALLFSSCPIALVLFTRVVRAAARDEYALAVPTSVTCAVLAITLQQMPDSAAGYPRSEWSLGFSAAQRQLEETRIVGYQPGECGDIPIEEQFDVRSRTVGGALGYTRHTSPTRARTIRLRGFAGTERTVPQLNPVSAVSSTVGAIGTSLTLDYKWVGVTAGFATGRFTSDTTVSDVQGIGGLRAGPLDSFHFFADVNNIEPLANIESRVGAAMGFPGGSTVRAGIWRGKHFFLNGTIVAGSFDIEPSFAFGDNDVRLAISRRMPISH